MSPKAAPWLSYRRADMDESEFTDRVTQAAETDVEEPDPIVKATVSLSREAFLERVGERADEYGDEMSDDTDELRPRVAAVTDAVAEAIPQEEQRGIRSQISDDVESLFTDGEGGR